VGGMNVECPVCGGWGKISYLCDRCGGSGEGWQENTTCSQCRGSGEVDGFCYKCEGDGVIPKKRRAS
jgi:DnaJ-class molecular chaperone